MASIAVYGASGFGREVMPILHRLLSDHGSASARGDFELLFVDDHPQSDLLNGRRVITYKAWLEEDDQDREVVMAIGDGQLRTRLTRRCQLSNVKILGVRAPTVVVMDDVEIGPGEVMCDHVTVTSNIRIGEGFQANLYSYVGHDCRIGDYVTFGPGAKCNGNVVIEDHAYIGAGAMIRQGRPGAPMVIGRGAVVGMGAVVTRSVPDGVTVVGNPARPF